MKSILKNKINANYFVITLLVISITVNAFFATQYHTEESHYEINSSGHTLLSKRIFTQNPNDVIINFVQLRKAIKEYVLSQNGDVGVYFDITSGGQVTYTSNNFSGQLAGKLTFTAKTIQQ